MLGMPKASLSNWVRAEAKGELALSAEDIHKPARSLHRMLSKSGNPSMSNILAVSAAVKRALKVEVHTRVVMV